MGDGFGWAVVLAAAPALVGVAAYPRGTQHHRGDEIRTHAARIVVVGTDAA